MATPVLKAKRKSRCKVKILALSRSQCVSLLSFFRSSEEFFRSTLSDEVGETECSALYRTSITIFTLHLLSPLFSPQYPNKPIRSRAYLHIASNHVFCRFPALCVLVCAFCHSMFCLFPSFVAVVVMLASIMHPCIRSNTHDTPPQYVLHPDHKRRLDLQY